MVTRPEESNRLWRVVVCDLDTSKEEAKSPLKGCEYKPTMGCDADRKKQVGYFYALFNDMVGVSGCIVSVVNGELEGFGKKESWPN